MCYARLPIFFILFFTDVTRSSDCIVSLYEVSVWAVSFSWHRGLSRPLLWFRISTLVFNWVNNYQNTEDFGNTANVDLTYCLSILCCFLFSSFTDNSFNSICSVYSGHHTILIPPGDLETNPALWLSVVSQYKGEFCSLLWMILLPNPTKKSMKFCWLCLVFLPSPRHVLFLPCYGFVYQGTGAVNTGAQGIVDILFERRHVSRKVSDWFCASVEAEEYEETVINVVSLDYKACGK